MAPLGKVRTGAVGRLPAVGAPALCLVLACSPAPPRARVELVAEPTTLSHASRLLSSGSPLPADDVDIGVCVYPAADHELSGRWTVVTPDGREAQVVVRAELVNGRVVTLASPWTDGSRLCVRPRLGGPLEAAVQTVRVVASTPIRVERIVWESTALRD